MDHEYRQEYARCAPIFRHIWQNRPMHLCRFALKDINSTLLGRKEMDGYAGRLYAELDAVWDRMMALKKEGV